MIDRIISFITYFPENLRFYIEEYEFFGLCLKPGDSFPWGNKKERNVYLDELVESEKGEELDRFLYWYEAWYLFRFHRKFSLGFIIHLLCYCALFFCFPAIFAKSIAALLMGVILVLVLLLVKFLNHRSISRLYFRLGMTKMAVDILKQNG